MKTSIKQSEQKPCGGGVPIPRKYAIELLKAGLNGRRGISLMCYEYGKGQGYDECEACEGECECWTGVTAEDLHDKNGNTDTLKGTLHSDYQTFELWM